MPVPTLTPTNFVVYEIDHQPLPQMGLSLFRSNGVTVLTVPKCTEVVHGTGEECQSFSLWYKSSSQKDVWKLHCWLSARLYGRCGKLRSFRLSWEAPVSNDCRFRNWTVEAWVLGSGEPED